MRIKYRTAVHSPNDDPSSRLGFLDVGEKVVILDPKGHYDGEALCLTRFGAGYVYRDTLGRKNLSKRALEER